MITFLMAIEDEFIRSKMAEIYKTYVKRLWHFANNFLHDDYESEDAVQEALLKSTKYINDDFDPNSNDSLGLMITIVRGVSKSMYKKNHKIRTVDIEGHENDICSDEAANPERYVLQLGQQEWLAEKLSEIKVEYSDLLSLKYHYGYTNSEIASMLSMSEGNVRVKLMRARKALHEIIGGESDGKAQ